MMNGLRWSKTHSARVLGLLALGFLLTGCDRPSAGAAPGVYYDFLANYASARIEPIPVSAEEAKVRVFEFVRSRSRKRSLITIADAQAHFAIPLVPAPAVLRGYLGMPFNLGDGALAELILVQEGRRHLLLERYVDAARRAADRAWIPVSVDLTPYAGRPAEIIFSARASTGDALGDWIGWAEPVICRP